MKVLYFAWLRERIGTGSEEIDPPKEVKTALDLVMWLKAQKPRYAVAFEDIRAIRVAIDQRQADFEQSIADASEIAFFPPVTGG